MENEYAILAYVDDLEEAIRRAQKNNMSSGLIKGLQSVHDDIVELEPLLKTDTDRKRLKMDVEKLIEGLLEATKSGDESLSLGNMRQIRDKVRVLKALLSKPN